MIALALLFSCRQEPQVGIVVEGPVPPTEPTDPTTPPEPEPEVVTVCDAGDAAWVARTMPLAMGRRPHGSDEAELWRQVAATGGRRLALRAMMQTPESKQAWSDWFEDELYVARTGDKAFGECFRGAALAPQNGQLAAWLRDQPPTVPYPRGEFSMADVIADALVLDDVSVIHRAYLFARTARPTTGANVSAEELEYNARVNFGELFMQTYLARNNVCMNCHNSEFSVTPDRTFPVGGLVEKAVFGSSSGIGDPDRLNAMFAVDGVFQGPDYDFSDPRNIQVSYPGLLPWGMQGACGNYVPPDERVESPDWLGQDERFLVSEYTSSGSVWDVESRLHAGVDALRGQGLVTGEDGSVEGDAALAWLLGMHLADRVWFQAVGSSLTIATGFPRNEGQRDVLGRLTGALVQEWSLLDLLLQVTTEEAYNPGLGCGAADYAQPALYDPWSPSDADPARHGNGPGDAAHALPPRILLRSAHDALGWPPPPEWRLPGSAEAVQAAIGVFLRESQPAFSGSDFQGSLEFEAGYGSCTYPYGDAPNDVLDQLVAAAPQATAGDLARIVRDRLLADPEMDATEVGLVEALLGVPLDTPAEEVADLRSALGVYCGALLLSPDFWLLSEAPPARLEAPWSSVEADCKEVARAVQYTGRAASCDDDGVLTLPDVQ